MQGLLGAGLACELSLSLQRRVAASLLYLFLSIAPQPHRKCGGNRFRRDIEEQRLTLAFRLWACCHHPDTAPPLFRPLLCYPGPSVGLFLPRQRLPREVSGSGGVRECPWRHRPSRRISRSTSASDGVYVQQQRWRATGARHRNDCS